MKKYITTCFVILLSLKAGCAAMINGTEDTIVVRSMEKGSVIYIDGEPRGVDDVITPVKRGSAYTIKATKPGCKEVITQTGRVLDEATLLGFFIDLGVFTMSTDMITGAAWKTDPLTYTVTPVCPV